MSRNSYPGSTGRRAVLAAGLSFLTVADGRSATSGIPSLARSDPEPAVSGRLSEAEFQRLAMSVSNWGKWGANDKLGALNLITPETIRRASQEIREGITVSCG